MLKAVATVCAALLVLTYYSEYCYSLEIHYEHVENNKLSDDEDLFAPETINYVGKIYEEPVTEIPKQTDDLFKLLFGENLYRRDIENNKIEDGSRKDEVEEVKAAVKSRVVRQAYPGQAPIYPKLPSSPPYNQPYPTFNNQNPQWPPPNKYSQQGYQSYGAANNYPSAQQNSTYGHNPYNPSQSQNPYNPYSQPTPPSFSGYRPPNSTVYNSGPSMPPYNQHGQINNNTYPGYPTAYKPGNSVNPYNPSQRPPYSPTTPSYRYPVTFANTTSNIPQYYNNHNTSNSFGNTGSNSKTPYAPYPPHNTQHFNSYPNNPYGQPNSTIPHSAPSHGPYHNPSNGGQYPAFNNAGPYGQPNSTVPHSAPNHGPYHNPSNGGQYPAYNNAGPYGQHPQSSNSYPQGPNQNPYNNPSNSQYAGSNNYPGNSHGSSTFNLADGYNPSIPSRPPYGIGPGQNNYRYPPGSNGTAHDPTRVSPEYFSYPHK